MSDDGNISDEEDWLDLHDFLYNEAVSQPPTKLVLSASPCTLTQVFQEDLATPAMPSPPYIDYDPDYDKSPNLSDWGFDHDDYWDQDKPSKRKRNNAGEDTDRINDGPKYKRRRLDCKKDTPGISLEGYNTAAPTVIWKSKRDLLSPPEGPIVTAGQGEKVALLKDWRERFTNQPNRAASRAEAKPVKSGGSQIATAVVIENDSPNTYNSTTLPPTTLEKAAGLPSRSRVFPSIPEHKNPVVNGTKPHMSDSQLISGGSNPNTLGRTATIAGKKRNISELPNHEEDELPPPKKRPGPPKKKTTYVPQTPKQPLANKTNTSIPESRKRKADDSDNQSIMSPRKRTETTETEVGEARVSEGNGSSTRRTTRRTR